MITLFRVIFYSTITVIAILYTGVFITAIASVLKPLYSALGL